MDPGAADAPAPESPPEPQPQPSTPPAPESPAPLQQQPPPPQPTSTSSSSSQAQPSRYESQKRRDWNTFLQYLKNHKPPLTLPRCTGAHVIEFLNYLDQFGKTKVHDPGCAFFGNPAPPNPCACPLRQAWGSLDALIGRLRAAYEENGGKPETNPFAAKAVRVHLREVRENQAKARGIPYEKKKRKRASSSAAAAAEAAGASSVTVAAAGEGSSSGPPPPAAAAAVTVAETKTEAAETGEGSGAPPASEEGGEPTTPPPPASTKDS